MWRIKYKMDFLLHNDLKVNISYFRIVIIIYGNKETVKKLLNKIFFFQIAENII